MVGTGVGGSTASAQSEYVPDDSTDNAEANEQNGNYDDRQSSEEAQTEEGEKRPRHKKLFSKDEGEYVDFEEIKE